MSVKEKCLSQFKNCLGVLFPSLLEDSTIIAKKDDTQKRGHKSKYQRITKNDEDDEGDEQEIEFDEEKKVSRVSTDETTTEDSAQFFNEFSSWRNNQASPSRQTELTDVKPKPAKKNLLSMSENEIERQKNTVGEDDDLFKGFQQTKHEQKEQKQSHQLNSFFNNLANKSSGQQMMMQESMEEQEEKKDVMEEKGWDEEINIQLE